MPWGHGTNNPGDGGTGSGGRIRTSDLWVMSPTSCHCSTPRHDRARHTDGGGRPQRPRLPPRYHGSTLRRCVGSRPGSGWDRVGPTRSRPRAPRAICIVSVSQSRYRLRRAHHEDRLTNNMSGHTPLTIRTPRLQSVTGCPPGAYQPGRLPGVSRTRRSWDVSSRGKIPA